VPPSRSFHLFREAVLELQEKLAHTRNEKAVGFRKEAQRLLRVFDDWDIEPPSDDDRVQVIKQVLDFSTGANRCVAEGRATPVPGV